MGTVHCPKDRGQVPMQDCLSCEFVRSDEDISNIWCRYLIGRKINNMDVDELIRSAEFKDR